MNKQEFLKEIKSKLNHFQSSELDEITNYYNEIIEDKMEAGLNEEEAINSLGSIETIVNEIKINIVSKRSDEKKTNTLKNFLIILGNILNFRYILVYSECHVACYNELNTTMDYKN
jgi:uncharacterized membrane protein